MDRARQMGIREERLSVVDGETWYTSSKFEDLKDLFWPSADTVTLRSEKEWGTERDTNRWNETKVSNFLNVERILSDVRKVGVSYPDMGIFDDFEFGGTANLRIPFKTLRLNENYKMEEKGMEKLRKKLVEESEKDFITTLKEWREFTEEWPTVRVHPMGLIPKSRVDRTLRDEGRIGEVAWRTISDMKKVLRDGTSVNSCSGEFGNLQLPQGDRILRMIAEAQAGCIKHGLDPKGLVIVKWDVKSAYRNFRVAKEDRWAFGFTFEGKYGTHKSWPFGNIASVYNFLRFPLLMVWYLSQSAEFIQSSAEAAMYFDDLMVVAHKDHMFKVATFVEQIFRDWQIPRQEEKFRDENPNGLYGCSRGKILGHVYDFTNETISIPAERIAEIMEEIQSFLSGKRSYKRKEWESIIGVLSWTKVVIPQIGPAMSSGYRMLQAWKKSGRGWGRRIPGEIKEDWNSIMRILKRWNGKMSFMIDKWPEKDNRRAFGIEPELYVEPTADASGSIGWGGACETGYVKGIWSNEEREMKIHVKEGLALWAVIVTFGQDLRGRRMKLKRVSLRSDNQALIAALKKGRSKHKDLNIVVEMIFDALIDNQLSLGAWRVKTSTQVKVTYIGTKENVLADALSRDDMNTFRNYADEHRLTVFPKLTTQRALSERNMRIWKEKVSEILNAMRSQATHRRPPQQG